ncbi:Glycosyl transferase family 2 [Blastococcus aurantiacus]|uniref:4,4'-diaponeurosporenoate glycosyltransferase n=1 Tax=Blastococcus aurantiacus TaxID=1550231 RepID=A0A1G7MTZ5_9ACTN|nr:glycosyltransferase [Blastococcus aurantiacus]SDF65212.1 Glycosyl transferase family 2 [Blastococcus aurantiacus]
MASVIIPAHQEESVIGRCLDTLLEGADPGVLEVIVVANGCTDGTAEVVARYGQRVRLRQLSVGSKTAALNAGDDMTSTFPRIYLDADVELSFQAARAVIACLDSRDPLLASPRRVLQVNGATRPVKWFLRAWEALQAARRESIGSGVYALNQAGRARFERFPDVIGDDRFVHGLFEAAEKRVAEAEVKVWPPRNLRELVKVRTRIVVGNMDHSPLQQVGPHRPPIPVQARHVLRDPTAIAALPLYLGVSLLVRLRARRRIKSADHHSWARAERRVS